MARKKEPPKPILASKFDFVESLDNVLHECMMMVNALDTVLRHGSEKLPKPIADVLQERCDALRKSIFTED